MAAEALELDADNAFVHVQNAHALGRYSQQIGVMEAFSEGLAGRVREHIDAALTQACAAAPEWDFTLDVTRLWRRRLPDRLGLGGMQVHEKKPTSEMRTNQEH